MVLELDQLNNTSMQLSLLNPNDIRATRGFFSTGHDGDRTDLYDGMVALLADAAVAVHPDTGQPARYAVGRITRKGQIKGRVYYDSRPFRRDEGFTRVDMSMGTIVIDEPGVATSPTENAATGFNSSGKIDPATNPYKYAKLNADGTGIVYTTRSRPIKIWNMTVRTTVSGSVGNPAGISKSYEKYILNSDPSLTWDNLTFGQYEIKCVGIDSVWNSGSKYYDAAYRFQIRTGGWYEWVPDTENSDPTSNFVKSWDGLAQSFITPGFPVYTP